MLEKKKDKLSFFIFVTYPITVIYIYTFIYIYIYNAQVRKLEIVPRYSTTWYETICDSHYTKPMVYTPRKLPQGIRNEDKNKE